MGQFKSILIAICMILIFGSGGAVLAENGNLEPAEADSLEFLLLFSELKQSYFENMSEHWEKPSFTDFAADEQRHFETLASIVAHYGVEVSDEYWGCNVVMWGFEELNFFCSPLVNERPWWDEWEDAVSVAAYFEELSIRELQRALKGTDEQILIDSYTEILGGAYVHLLKFAEMLYHHPLDYIAQLLDQNEVDSALIEAITMLSGDFVINAGLNDAWYNPDTTGQGFFITVYEESGTVFLAWLTYDTELPGQDAHANLGDSCQRWITAQGTYDGAQAALTVYNTRGGLFDTSIPIPVSEQVGSILLQFDGCSTGSIAYDLPGFGVSGEVLIQRLAEDNVAACLAQAYLNR